MIYKFFDQKNAWPADKSTSSTNISGSAFKSETVKNKEFTKELNKAVITKFEKRKID